MERVMQLGPMSKLALIGGLTAAACWAGLALAADGPERRSELARDKGVESSMVVAQKRERRRGRRRAEPVRREAAKERAPVLDTIEAARYEAGRTACRALLAGKSIEFTDAPPAEKPPCVVAAPVRVMRIGRDKVPLAPAVEVDCRVAYALAIWIDAVVQPAAREVLGSPVKAITSASGAVCRPRNNLVGAPLSEHAFGKAVDIARFVLADGREVAVIDWKETVTEKVANAPETKAERLSKAKDDSKKEPVQSQSEKASLKRGAKTARAEPANSKEDKSNGKSSGPASKAVEVVKPAPSAVFLRRVHDASCGLFTTVLGPESDALHRDHFHLDLSQRKSGSYCR